MLRELAEVSLVAGRAYPKTERLVDPHGREIELTIDPGLVAIEWRGPNH